MPTPPPFILPPERLTDRLRDHACRLLAGAGRQRVVLAIVALVAVACAALIWFRGTPRPLDPTLAGARSTASAPLLTSATGVEAVASSVPPAAGEGAASGMLAVDVVGRVRHPGLVRLPAGSRVVDAIQAAGGAAPGADLDAVNLARKLADGEQLRATASRPAACLTRRQRPGAPPAGSRPRRSTSTPPPPSSSTPCRALGRSRPAGSSRGAASIPSPPWTTCGRSPALATGASRSSRTW